MVFRKVLIIERCDVLLQFVEEPMVWTCVFACILIYVSEP